MHSSRHKIIRQDMIAVLLGPNPWAPPLRRYVYRLLESAFCHRALGGALQPAPGSACHGPHPQIGSVGSGVDPAQAAGWVDPLEHPTVGEGPRAFSYDGRPSVGPAWAQAASPGTVYGVDDPDFERKAADIIGLYLNPLQHAAISD